MDDDPVNVTRHWLLTVVRGHHAGRRWLLDSPDEAADVLPDGTPLADCKLRRLRPDETREIRERISQLREGAHGLTALALLVESCADLIASGLRRTAILLDERADELGDTGPPGHHIIGE